MKWFRGRKDTKVSFTNPVNNLTIPSGATSGQSRIVIGPDIPEPLRSFVPAGHTGVTAAILFYDANPHADSYWFIANIESMTQYNSLWYGSVTGGVIDKGLPALSGGADQPFGLQYRNTGSGVSILVHGLLANDPVFGCRDDQVQLRNFGTYLDNLTWPLLTADHVNTFDPNNSGAVEQWHTLAPQNGWVAFGAPFAPLRYRKVASPPNNVQINGFLVGGTSAAGTLVATLPAFYRPAFTQRFPIYLTGATSIAAETPAVQVAATTGQMTLLACAGPAGAGQIHFDFLLPLD